MKSPFERDVRKEKSSTVDLMESVSWSSVKADEVVVWFDGCWMVWGFNGLSIDGLLVDGFVLGLFKSLLFDSSSW